MISDRRTFRLDRKNRKGRRSRGTNQNALVFFSLGCFAIASFLIAMAIFRRVETSPEKASVSSLLRTSRSPYDWPVVHVVNTRFMQDQGHLTTLAKARLELFRAFCLPTMTHQTTQQFIWIIKVDPKLDPEVRNEMVDLLKEYPNFFLVGSNINYQVGSGSEGGTWRNGVEGSDVLHSPIYTGDINLLHRAHEARNSRVVLETRLDADDGLHTEFIKYVQKTALESFSSNKHLHWLYWCSRRHLEWYPDTTTEKMGLLNPIEHSRFCISPGITVGVGPDVRSEQVPEYAHDQLYKAVEANGGCGLSRNIDCIHLVEKLLIVAVRSRTFTSAGMKDTKLDPSLKAASTRNQQMWSFLEKHFNVLPDAAQQASEFIQENLKQIAKENLDGQCTSGHSCKLKSVEQLQRLIEVEIEAPELVTVQ